MLAILRRAQGYLEFVRKELREHPAPVLAHLDALWRCKHSLSLAVMHPEVRRARSYIPATLFTRRQRAYSQRTGDFFKSKITQQLWLERCFPEYAPPTLYYIGLSGLVPIAPAAQSRPLSDLPIIIREHNGLFAKPSDGGHGSGIAHLVPSGNGIELNGEPMSDDGLIDLARAEWHGYVISKIIENSTWSGKFYPRTLNTLRILTGVDRAARTPHVLSAIFKIGRDSSFPADNWQRGLGGVTAKVDLTTGRLGPAVEYVPGRGGGRRVLATHPDSGAAIEGDAVPDWPAVTRLVLDLAAQCPFFGLVGWDVALTPSGIVIVEGNGTPGLDIHEAHESLLATAEQRTCFAGMKIFPRRNVD